MAKRSVTCFDGQQSHVVLGKAPRLGLTEHDFTIEAWVQIDGDADGRELALLGTDEIGDSRGLHLVIRNRRPYLGFYNNDTAGATELAPGLWYHLAWRYDLERREQSVFVNGVLDAIGTDKGPFLGRGEIILGRWGGGSQFSGRIADLRVWSIARSGDAILADLHRQLRGDEPGLASYWRLDREPGDEGELPSERCQGGSRISGQPQEIEVSALAHPRCGSLHLAGEDGHLRLPLAGSDRSVTYELWFRTERRDCGLFSSLQAEGGAHDAHLFLKGGNLRAQVAGSEIGSQGLNLGDGRWHHVAHVVGPPGGERRLYVDGLMRASGPLDETAAQPLGIGVLGYSLAAARTHFEGEMAEVRLWNTEVAEEALRRHRNLRLAGGEPGLVGLWPLTKSRMGGFGDGAGTTVTNLVAQVDEAAASGPGELLGGGGYVDDSPPWQGQHTLVLEGAGVVEIPGKPGVGFAAHTLEAWVLPRKGPLAAHGLPLIVSRGYTLRLLADGTLRHVLSPGGSPPTSGQMAGSLHWDRWNHLALSYDGRRLRTVVDGELVSDVEATGDPWRRSTCFEVQRDPAAVVAMVYDGEDFTGASLALRGGDHDLAALRAGGFCDDCLSSLRVAPGWQVTLFEDDGFAGRSQTFVDDASTVGEAMDNRSSSLRVEWVGSSPATVSLHGDDCETLDLFEGAHDFEDLVVDGIGPRSVRVSSGWRLEISEGGGSVQELVPQGLESATLDLTSPLLTLGGRLDGRDPVGLRGRLADLRLWSVARSADEIASQLDRRLSGREEGLVGWWPLAESNDPEVAGHALDASGNHRHGTVTHGRRGLPPSPFRRALRLDGASWFEIAGAPEIDLADGEGTLELWLRPDREQSADAHHSVLEKWQGSRGYPYSVRYFSDSGKIGIGRSRGAEPHPTVVSHHAIDDEAFHHVALVRRRRDERMELALFLDGREEGSILDDTCEVRNAADLYVGCRAGTDHFFAGEITELRCWNHALDADRLLSLGGRRANGDEPGLVGYWPLDRVDGKTVASGLSRPIGRAEGTEVATADLPLLSYKVPRAPKAPAGRFDGQCSQVVIREPVEVGFGVPPGASVLRFAGPMTVEAWVFPTRAGDPLAQPVAEHCGPDSGWALRCSRDRAVFRITVEGQPVEVSLPLELRPGGSWIHLAGRYDGNHLMLLANGASSGRARRPVNGMMSPADPDLSLHLGGHPDRASRFAGDLAEVRLWSRARSFEEIHRDLFQRLPGLPKGEQHPGLVACWPLDGRDRGVDESHVRDVGGRGLAGVGEAVDWVDVELPPRLKAAKTLVREPDEQIAALRAELLAVRQQRDEAHQELGTLNEKVGRLSARQDELKAGMEEQKSALRQSFEVEIAEQQAQIAELEDKRQDWQEGRFSLEDVYTNAIEQVERARQKIDAGEGAYRLGKVDVELRYVALDGGSTAAFPALEEKIDESRFTTHRIALAPRQPVETATPKGLEVPDLKGTTEVLARRMLVDAGLQPEVHLRAVDPARLEAIGRVIEQIPRPGTELAPNSPVLIFLGKESRSAEG